MYPHFQTMPFSVLLKQHLWYLSAVASTALLVNRPWQRLERMLVIALIPTSRWSLQLFMFSVWYQCALAELWMPECALPFYPVHIRDLPLGFLLVFLRTCLLGILALFLVLSNRTGIHFPLAVLHHWTSLSQRPQLSIKQQQMITPCLSMSLFKIVEILQGLMGTIGFDNEDRAYDTNVERAGGVSVLMTKAGQSRNNNRCLTEAKE